jgi:hypothetical protein
MSRLLKHLNTVKKLKVNVLFDNIFNRNEVKDYVTKLIKEQLGRGEDGKGESLPDYSTVSIDLYGKPTQNNPFYDPSGGDSIRLFSDGTFYNSVTVASIKKGVALLIAKSQFKGDQGESVDLQAKYGNDLITLNDESINKLCQFVLPFTIKDVRESIL